LNNNLKILHVITRLDPGGSSYISEKMVEGLRERGFDAVLASGKSEFHGEYVIKLKYLQREINLFKDFPAVIELAWLMRQINPDIVHLHTSKAGAVGRVAAKLAGVKKVYYQPHGIVFYGYFSPIKSKIILIVEKLLARYADTIIALSERSKEEFIEYKVGKPRQYKVIENGIDCSLFYTASPEEKAEVKKKLGISPECITAGIAGRLVKLKGHEYYLKAMRKVIDKNSSVKGVIIGDGELKDELAETTKKLFLQNNIVFTGFRKDIPDILQAVDILVQPSVVEGFGITLIEAGASGIPAVGFRAGGIENIIIDGKTGFLADYLSADSLSEKILKLAENPSLREEMGKKARERVIKNYTVESMMNKLMELYGAER